MDREIVLDTETTGLDPNNGDRLIEIGCIELINRIPSGREFHAYINPERDVPIESQNVHGITTEFLQDKPLFSEVAQSFLEFIAADDLVIHNAAFDIGFLNAELERISLTTLSMQRVVDTLQIARRKHPGGPNSLDALCKRYGIDNSMRSKHGALLDSLLLAEVYLELLGERQATFELTDTQIQKTKSKQNKFSKTNPRPSPLPSRLNERTISQHQEFITTLGEDALWWQYISPPETH